MATMTNLERANCEAMLRHPDPHRLRGLSPHAAQITAERLCAVASETGDWKNLPELLAELRLQRRTAA